MPSHWRHVCFPNEQNPAGRSSYTSEKRHFSEIVAKVQHEPLHVQMTLLFCSQPWAATRKTSHMSTTLLLLFSSTHRGNTPVPEEHFQRNSFWSAMVAFNVAGLHDGHLLQKVSTSSYPSGKVITRKPRKKVRAIICVLFVELFERFTFLGIVCNMILFCTIKLGYDNYQAATVNLCFVGASTLTPVLVGWFAEMCLGRRKVFYLCALLHFFGESLF